MARGCAQREVTTDIIRKHLARVGLRYTQDRERVLRHLMTHTSPVSIEELTEQFKGQVHKVTLYRMLEQFTDRGIVVRSYDTSGTRLYEYQQSHHHHVTCVSCGKRNSISLPESDLSKHVLRQACDFAHINGHTFEYYGVCKQCNS